MEAAAVRPSVQVGGPPPGQRASDPGPPSSQQSQQPPPPTLAYQQRITSGASPIHRPVDTPQSYTTKGGIGPPPSQQNTSRSATSPLSPPRPGGAANHTAYPRFTDAVTATSLRYVPQTQYGVGQVQQFRENPYARISTVPGPPPSAAMQDYHRAAAAAAAAAAAQAAQGPGGNSGGIQPVVTGSGSMSMVSVGSAGPMETSSVQGHPPGRQRMSLISQQQPPHQSQLQQQHPPPPSEYMSANARPAPQAAPPDPGGQPFKKIRIGENNHPPAQSQQASATPSQQQQPPSQAPQPLKVDTRDHRPANTEAYHPQVEAISPTLPNDTIEERRTTKDDLLNQISKVDNEIEKATNAKTILMNKEKALEEASSAAKQQPSKEPETSEVPPRHRSLAQKIYADNRKRAAEQHAVLGHLGPLNDLPLYNQPSDMDALQEVIKRHETIKVPLMMHLRREKTERAARNAKLVEEYAQLSQDWLKRVEKIESSAKRKAKEAKNREIFEKIFTELRKQREDKERFNRVGSRIKSEADLEEIMDGLQEQAMEDKKMRSYAVIPPLMFDARQRRCAFSNENGFLGDMITDYKEQQNLNVWTAGEKEIFKEKFLQHPKNFGAIASNLDRKSAQDCVRYYYLSKKTENYKQLLRKSRQRTRSSRNPQKSQQQQAQCIVDSLTTGVTTRLQREQQQKTGGRDRAAQSTASGAAAAAAAAAVAASAASSSVPSSTTSTTTSAISASCSTAAIVGSTNTSSSSSSSSSTSSLLSATNVPSPGKAVSSVTASVASTTTTIAATATAVTTTSTASSKNATETGNSGSSITTTLATGGPSENSLSSTNGPSSNVPNSSENSIDTNKEQLASSVNSTEKHSSFDSSTSSSTSTKVGGVALDDANLTKTSGTNTSTSTSTNCNSVPGTGVTTTTTTNSTDVTSVTTMASGGGGGANSLPTPPPSSTSTSTTTTLSTMPTFNGLKTELVISNAVNLADGKSLCNDKERKSPTVVVSATTTTTSGGGGGDDKSSSGLNSCLGIRPRPGSADSSDASEPKKSRLDSDSSSNQTSLLANNEKTPDATADSKDKFHPCFVCKAESCPRTRPLKKGRGQQYGIPDDTIPAGARVCNSCQCKSVRNRYPNCPLPTCPNSKDRAKNNIPSRLYELAPEIRDAILQEFQIPPNATKCCSACLMRIRRKLDPHSQLTDDERRNMLTDGDESDLSTSSCDERDAASSDTASAESPNNPLRPNLSQKDDGQGTDPTIVPLTRKASSFEDDRLLPPLGQAPRKQKTTEEYDSSATETADEENENSPANRQSPKSSSLLHSNLPTTPNSSGLGVSSMIAPISLQNGPPRELQSEQTNVREIVCSVIEMSVKTPSTKPSLHKQPTMLNDLRGGDVSFVREYRNDIGPKISTTSASLPPSMHTVQQVAQQLPQARQLQSQQVSSAPPDSLATLSVVNSQSHVPQPILSHQHGITATITPVKAPMQSQPPQSQPPSQHQAPGGVIAHEMPKDDMYSSRNEPEPQTLDLSIKKSSRDSMPSHAHMSHAKVPPQQHTSSMPMYRNDQPPNSQPPPNSAYLTYHHSVDLNRPTKSPSIYVSQVPAPLSQSGVRSQPAPPPQPQSMAMQHQQQQMAMKKIAPKLSPKIHQSPSPSQMMSSGGPKGSITHGTPVNSQPQMLIQSASPRYEGMPRQTPPGSGDGNKLGSITQGTPVHHIQDKQRVYYDYKGNRQSPAQQAPPPSSQSQSQLQPPQQSSPHAPGFMGSPYGRPAYALEQTQQLSSRQIVMNDYITSQQMHGQHCRQGRNEKESQSPRTSMMYYAEKDRGGRPEFLSRTSPAEHINSTPSPHRTPPPQRQGVIQRHNTGGSKPPSPLPNRHQIMSHYPSAGHEAFSSFVEVAVQQPQLPVPQKEDKRAVLMSTSEHQGPSPHFDIRYPITHEQQMQIHHHQQQQHQHMQRQQQAAAVDMQRRIHAQQERDHRERQERENAERQSQERLQAERDRIERERERERDRERLRLEEQEREEQRRRESVRNSMSSSGGMSMYMRSKLAPQINRGMPPEREREAPPLTSAAIIDAIIQNSIKGTSEPLARRDSGRSQFYATREPPHPSSISISENNGKSSSPNVINVELDGERGPPGGRKQEIGTITLGELTDSIINKDYGPNPVLSRAYMMPHMQESIVTTDQFQKYRRMQQKEAEQAAHAAAAANAAAAERNKSVQQHGRSNTPDERQIIRMAQPPSPRKQFSLVPQGHYYSSVHGGPPPQQSVPSNSPIDRRIGGTAPSHQVEFDRYVKNRIVEAMRTEDGGRGDDPHHHGPGGHHDQSDGMRSAGHYGREMDGMHQRPNSGSGGGHGGSHGGNSQQHHGYEDDRRSMSNSSGGGMPMGMSNNDSHGPPPPMHGGPPQSQQSAPVTTFASTTCAYPYNILNVSGPPPSSKQVDSGVPPPPPQQTIAAEPKPLLVPHYEALSDED